MKLSSIGIGNHISNYAYQVSNIENAICFVSMFRGINKAIKNKAGYVVFLHQKYYENYCIENQHNVCIVELH